MAIIDDIKRRYRHGSMLMKIIYINIAIFVLLRVAILVASLSHAGFADLLLQWLELPSSLGLLLVRPWTLITYMFSHYDVWHILFNMLWLYWLGRIFMEYFSPKQLAGLYLLGGLGGALLFIAVYAVLPNSASPALIGASASVIAIVAATAVYAPDYKIGLLFLGAVSLKWIAIVTVGIDLLTMDVSNPGSAVSHIGGALTGVAFALCIKGGRDITRPVNAVVDFVAGLFGGRKMPRPKFKKSGGKAQARPQGRAQQPPRGRTPADTVSEEELDAILGKIKVSGYDALTSEEKDKLFKASRRREP